MSKMPVLLRSGTKYKVPARIAPKSRSCLSEFYNNIAFPEKRQEIVGSREAPALRTSGLMVGPCLAARTMIRKAIIDTKT
jgi:hypothetical protein